MQEHSGSGLAIVHRSKLVGHVLQSHIEEPRAHAVITDSVCLPEHVVVVDRVVMADVAEFDVVGAEKFEDNPIGSIDAKAPDFVMLRMEFLAVK